jgi:hypothetical protein
MKTFRKLRSFMGLVVLLIALSTNLKGQIKVFDNGNVGIKYTTSTPLSKLVLNSPGVSNFDVYFYSGNRSSSGGAFSTLIETGTGSSNHIYGINGGANLGANNFLYGVRGGVTNSAALTVGRAYGVYGIAGNATAGYNYGVYGYLYGSNNGAAVFGTINGLGDISVPGQYAGYFRGNVKCENIMYATTFSVQSDEKLKTNIQDLSSEESLLNISKISPKRYYLKQVEVIQQPSDTTSIIKDFNASDQLFIKAKYGVLAQDLQKILPDLVYQDGDGALSVDYIGLIPLTIKAIQAQLDKISVLEEKVAALTKQLDELAKK